VDQADLAALGRRLRVDAAGQAEQAGRPKGRGGGQELPSGLCGHHSGSLMFIPSKDYAEIMR
jgi:hypothetical protein